MIGIIDIGTNTILYLKASLQGPEATIISDNRIHHRSGQRLDSQGGLTAEYKADLRKALLQALADMGNCPEIKIVATEVLRRPLDGAEFAGQLTKEIGRPIEIIEAGREAELSFAGATKSGAASGLKSAVIDIGGGSTEIAVGMDGKLEAWAGIQLGAAAICEAVGYEKDYREYATRARQGFDRSDFTKLMQSKPAVVLAVGGSAVGVAALSKKQARFVPGDIQGLRIEIGKLGELLKSLSDISLERRKKLMTFDPQRADIIVGGGAILWSFMKKFEIASLQISTFGLRHGLLWELFAH